MLPRPYRGKAFPLGGRWRACAPDEGENARQLQFALGCIAFSSLGVLSKKCVLVKSNHTTILNINQNFLFFNLFRSAVCGTIDVCQPLRCAQISTQKEKDV